MGHKQLVSWVKALCLFDPPIHPTILHTQIFLLFILQLNSLACKIAYMWINLPARLTCTDFF